MAVRFHNNKSSEDVTVDITAELDEGAFFLLTVTDDNEPGNSVDVVDILLTDVNEVEEFRREVNQACDDFLRLTSEAENDG